MTGAGHRRGLPPPPPAADTSLAPSSTGPMAHRGKPWQRMRGLAPWSEALGVAEEPSPAFTPVFLQACCPISEPLEVFGILRDAGDSQGDPRKKLEWGVVAAELQVKPFCGSQVRLWLLA